MKLNGIIGKGTGKLGSSVFAISGGEQVVREYNPVVSNPNTEAQIAQRAKLKLMSQLGAALAPALGFKKMGLVSARNQFVSKNIGLSLYANNEASVDITGLELTDSAVSFPRLILDDAGSGSISVMLEAPAASDIKRVAYFVYEVTDDTKLRYVASAVESEAGDAHNFPHAFNVGSGKFVAYAYGIKDNNTTATIRYEEYAANYADAEATLAVESLFRSSAYGLTKSVAAKITLA